ncbi:MAG TPA: phosphoribosyltransferase family protein [Thermoanaerobaculia bacterium]|nr:phosphoribosyltransferase family protein [Thermoanaerobaculia bacterium]
MSPTTRIEPAFSAEQIAARISALGAEIRADAGKSEVFLLGILKGTSCLLADLMRAIPGDVSYGFIDVVRDIADTEIATAIEIDFVSYTSIGGRNVYVLKDVVSTGVIENYLLSQLRIHRPRHVKLVALLDRPDLRTVDLPTDFRAFEVGDGAWVGYGLEIDGRHGNLPYIGKK